MFTETEIWVLGNQGFVYDTQRQYTLNIECSDQRRSDSGEFYVYILRNMPPYFSNLQGKCIVIISLNICCFWSTIQMTELII